MDEIGFSAIFAQHFDRPTPVDSENSLKSWIEIFGSRMIESIGVGKKRYIIKKC